MTYDVCIIGGGPAGLAAALAVKEEGGTPLIIEREGELGGILKQCIHDGFGLVRFKEKLSGPEYAERFIEKVEEQGIETLTFAFVTKIEKTSQGFTLKVVTKDGIKTVEAKKLILATGCRERTAKQVSIHGTRPWGVLTAGACQNFVNIQGVMPTKRCVILGSGDIGLIMARRITLEGGKVLGVFEAKPTPSGLTRNISQCLDDFGIPLYLSKTVTKVFGDGRLTAVEVSDVDERMNPIKGTEKIIECDGLILSVGLIPENELGEKLGIEISKTAKGAKCDENFETTVDGVFTAGNATHVNDLVDYVSESGEIAGRAAMKERVERVLIDVEADENTLYVVPETVNKTAGKCVMYFRSKGDFENKVAVITVDGKEIFSKKYSRLRPPEMERIIVDFKKVDLSEKSEIKFCLKEAER